jgi:hypothetical protein
LAVFFGSFHLVFSVLVFFNYGQISSIEDLASQSTGIVIPNTYIDIFVIRISSLNNGGNTVEENYLEN